MQIVEISSKEEQKNELIVGIDFGTTHSLIAYAQDGQTNVFTSDDGNELLPSIIYFDHKGNPYVSSTKPEDKTIPSIVSIKRLLSKTSAEINNNPLLQRLSGGMVVDSKFGPKIQVKDKQYELTYLVSLLFAEMKLRAEKHLKQDVSSAVISVPAHFNDAERGCVIKAANIAGFEVRRLIAEPTSAAYAYHLNNQDSGKYLVYDLGGGTFDVSVLKMQQGVLQVIATNGDNMLGGDDMDNILANYCAKELNILQIDNELLTKAKEAKIQLSAENAVEINYKNNILSISRSKFEQLIAPLITKTINMAKNTLLEAESSDLLKSIILVGGASKVPFIYSALKQEFGLVEILSSISQDHAVVIGAALQAENLSYRSQRKQAKNLLIDVVPLSLAIELYGGIAEKIIERNTPLPCTEKQIFTTQADNQTSIQIHILQGEREMAKDCRSLAYFELNNLPLAIAGSVQIEVIFSLDSDGVLSVSAKELKTGNVQMLNINPTYNLDDKQLENHLQNAYDNVAIDHEARLLLEANLDAQELITRLSSEIKKQPNLLPKDEMNELNFAISTLQSVLNSKNRQHILDKTNLLHKIAENFIEKYLNNIAKNTLIGKSIDEIN